ncbi:hypothetical protein CTI12_AA516090 [Artemisia annua]|uniref:COI1 F-box domain-containing protein n=1 Tax=Artemisia annua TaxID=35608 RepID=A0A2U1L327_ARTAN|nr:hypothetical protein CTI12_AA516090 [Artemisia annua]
MENVIDYVVPYIHDGDDLKSFSLVSRQFYQLDCITRKHLTVHLHYAPDPSTLSKRFPFIDSLTLKGPPDDCDFPQISGIDITPWIDEICAKFECLKALHIRGLVVSDEHLALLAKTRGKDLRSLKICECGGFSEDGLLHISEYCNDLRSLCLEYNAVDGEVTGEWVRELALRNTPIESLHLRSGSVNYDVEILTLVAQKCSNSLVSLKVSGPKPLNHLGDAFSHAVKLQDFHGAVFDKDGDYTSFKFPPSIRSLGIRDMPVTSFSLLLPYVNQLRELNLTGSEKYCQCFLIERCPNLEVLVTTDICGDMGFHLIGQVCKKLRKLIHCGHVTHMGLIALVQGCTNLEYLHVTLSNISNEAIECVGTHLKNLRDFRMTLFKKASIDNGIRAMLKGCIKLKRLSLHLGDEGLTDVGLGYIGKYGHNLTYLFLSCKGVSDAGLLELSKGCPKLRKLHLWDCPFSEKAVATFVFNIHSLRYIWVGNGFGTTDLALTRPTFTAEVLTELIPYVTLAEKLHKLAIQLIADGSGLGSVKITYTSSIATDNLDTPLVRAMVAKGICVNEEQVFVDVSSDKPLEIIKVQIVDVESRLAGEIKVEGRVKDGVPYLTKVGALDVDVSLEGNIILCRQAPDQPNIITSVSSILDDDNVIISSMSFGRIAQRKQAVMVIGVDEKPSKKALNRIDEIPAVDDFVFLAS